MEQDKIRNRIGIAIFLLLFFSYCYFFQPPWNWNSVPRIGLGISMVEDGSLDINQFALATGDKAYYEGNYYSDKAPGMTFIAIPAIAATKLYLDSTQGDYRWVTHRGKTTREFGFVMLIATIVTSGFLTALAGLALYFVAIRFGAGLGGAAFGALAYGLATPAWGWATAFFGHASASAFLFLGLASVVYLLYKPSAKRRDIMLGFATGAFLSWAVVIEYTSALAGLIIAIYALASAWQWERDRLIRVVLSALAGAVLFILPLLIYNYAIYGNILMSGYKYTVQFPGMKQGFYGINVPSLEVVARLLFDYTYGILWLSPLLLFVPLALYRLWKTPVYKGLAITIIAITLYYILWNSGYKYWTGGGSIGPRHLTPILPFVCLSLALLWTKAGNVLKSGLLLFFGISFLISLMSVSVSMLKAPPSNVHIVTQYLVHKFLEASHLKTSFLIRLVSPSLDGMHVLPLLTVLAMGGLYILWELRRVDRDSSSLPG